MRVASRINFPQPTDTFGSAPAFAFGHLGVLRRILVRTFVIIIIHLFRKKLLKLNQNKKEIAKAITKEIISPVIKMFQRIQIQTHYKDECWSIDLIDRSSLSKYNKKLQVYFHNK